MSNYTKNNGIFLLAAGVYLLSKMNNSPSNTPSAVADGGYTPQPIQWAAPVTRDAVQNISNTYGETFAAGVQQAIATSTTVSQALDAIGKLPTDNSLRNSSPPIEFNTTGEKPKSPYDVDYLKKFTPIAAPAPQKVVVAARQYDQVATMVTNLRQKAAGSKGSRKEYFTYAADREQAELNNWIRGN